MTPFGAPYYSWTTTKTATGFAFTVTRVQPTREADEAGRYCIDTIMKTGGGFATRARAKSAAVKWCRYLKATA